MAVFEDKEKPNEGTKLADDIPEKQVFQCKDCEVVKESIDDMKVHIQTMHKITRVDLQSKDKIPLRCKQCEYTRIFSFDLAKT